MERSEVLITAILFNALYSQLWCISKLCTALSHSFLSLIFVQRLTRSWTKWMFVYRKSVWVWAISVSWIRFFKYFVHQWRILYQSIWPVLRRFKEKLLHLGEKTLLLHQKQTNRQTNGQRSKETLWRRDKGIKRQRDKERDTDTERQREKERKRQRDKEANRQRDRDTKKQTGKNSRA